MSRTKPCIRCNSRCSLFWYSIAVGGEEIGELCDHCYLNFVKWVKHDD